MERLLREAFVAANPWVSYTMNPPERGVSSVVRPHYVYDVPLAEFLETAGGGVFAGYSRRVLVRGAFRLLEDVALAPHARTAVVELQTKWNCSISEKLEREQNYTPRTAPFPLLLTMNIPWRDHETAYHEQIELPKKTRGEWAEIFHVKLAGFLQEDDDETLREFFELDLKRAVEEVERDFEGTHTPAKWKELAPTFQQPGFSLMGSKPFVTAEEYAGEARASEAQHEFREALLVYPRPRTERAWEERSVTNLNLGGGDLLTLRAYCNAKNKTVDKEFSKFIQEAVDIVDGRSQFYVPPHPSEYARVSEIADHAAHAAMHRILDAEITLFECWDAMEPLFRGASNLQANFAMLDVEAIKAQLNGLNWYDVLKAFGTAVVTRGPAGPSPAEVLGHQLAQQHMAQLWGLVAANNPVRLASHIDTTQRLSGLRSPAEYAAFLGHTDDTPEVMERVARGSNRGTSNRFGMRLRDVRAFAKALEAVPLHYWYRLCAFASKMPGAASEVTIRAAMEAHARFLDVYEHRWERDVGVLDEAIFLAHRSKRAREFYAQERAAQQQLLAEQRARMLYRAKGELTQYLAAEAQMIQGRLPIPEVDVVVGLSRSKRAWVIAKPSDTDVFAVYITSPGDAPNLLRLLEGAYPVAGLGKGMGRAAMQLRRIVRTHDPNRPANFGAGIEFGLARYGVPMTVFASRYVSMLGNTQLRFDSKGEFANVVVKVGEYGHTLLDPTKPAGVLLKKQTLEDLSKRDLVAKEEKPEPAPKPLPGPALFWRDDKVDVRREPPTEPGFIALVPGEQNPQDWCAEANRFVREDNNGAVEGLKEYLDELQLILRDAPRPAPPKVVVVPMQPPPQTEPEPPPPRSEPELPPPKSVPETVVRRPADKDRSPPPSPKRVMMQMQPQPPVEMAAGPLRKQKKNPKKN